MNLDKETQNKIQEIQILEQNLQGMLLQKQSFQLELNETINALEEVKKTDDSIYKILGPIMLKGNKDSIIKELEEKKKILDMRVEATDKQEKLLESKAKELQGEAEKLLKKAKETK